MDCSRPTSSRWKLVLALDSVSFVLSILEVIKYILLYIYLVTVCIYYGTLYDKYRSTKIWKKMQVEEFESQRLWYLLVQFMFFIECSGWSSTTCKVNIFFVWLSCHSFGKNFHLKKINQKALILASRRIVCLVWPNCTFFHLFSPNVRSTTY